MRKLDSRTERWGSDLQGISSQLLLDDQRGIKKGQAICKKGLFSHFLSSGISVPSDRISLARAKGISGVWVGPPEDTY